MKTSTLIKCEKDSLVNAMADVLSTMTGFEEPQWVASTADEVEAEMNKLGHTVLVGAVNPNSRNLAEDIIEEKLAHIQQEIVERCSLEFVRHVISGAQENNVMHGEGSDDWTTWSKSGTDPVEVYGSEWDWLEDAGDQEVSERVARAIFERALDNPERVAHDMDLLTDRIYNGLPE